MYLSRNNQNITSFFLTPTPPNLVVTAISLVLTSYQEKANGILLIRFKSVNTCWNSHIQNKSINHFNNTQHVLFTLKWESVRWICDSLMKLFCWQICTCLCTLENAFKHFQLLNISHTPCTVCILLVRILCCAMCMKFSNFYHFVWQSKFHKEPNNH